ASEQRAAPGSDAARSRDRPRHRLAPGMRAQRVAGRLAVLVLQWRQPLAAIEADRPASLPAHLVRSHLGDRLAHAGLEVSALAFAELGAPGGGQAAARILGGAFASPRRCTFPGRYARSLRSLHPRLAFAFPPLP